MRKVGPSNPFAVTDSRVKPATEAQVAKLERRIGAKLPDDYRQFLTTVNGGERPGSGWELPRHDLVINTFYGLRRDFFNLSDALDRVLKWKEGTGHYPPDVIPIGDELRGNSIIMKCVSPGLADTGGFFENPP